MKNQEQGKNLIMYSFSPHRDFMDVVADLYAQRTQIEPRRSFVIYPLRESDLGIFVLGKNEELVPYFRLATKYGALHDCTLYLSEKVLPDPNEEIDLMLQAYDNWETGREHAVFLWGIHKDTFELFIFILGSRQELEPYANAIKKWAPQS